MSELIAKINGRSFSGWKEIQIEKSIEQIASAFVLSTSDKFPGAPSNWNIEMGNDCILEINNQVVLTGYVNDIDVSYTNEERIFTISGRGKTADLIDCSFMNSDHTSEFIGQRVGDLIVALCAPFDISVVFEDSSISESLEVIDSFVIDQGASPFTLITKLTKPRGLLPIDIGDGFLTITKAGELRTSHGLVSGVNILEGLLHQSNKSRFSNYYVKSQGVGADTLDLPSFIQPGGQAVDPYIKRFRPLIVFAEDDIDSKTAELRAGSEAINRMARSRRYIYTTQDWAQVNGDVWPINELISVKDNAINKGEEKILLIVRLTFTQGENEGTRTRFVLSHKQGYTLLDNPPEFNLKVTNTPYDQDKATGATIVTPRPFPRSLLVP